MLRLRTGLGLMRHRLYPQLFVWTGDAGDGLWSNPGNWENSTRAPTSIDEAVIASGSDNIFYDPTAAPVGSVTIQSGFSGTLTLQRDFEVIYDYIQDGGTVDTAGYDFKCLGFHLTSHAFYARSSDMDIGGHLVIGLAASFDAGTSHILHRNGYLSNGVVANAFYKYETPDDAIISLTGDVYLHQGALVNAAVFGDNTIFYGNSSLRVLSLPESTPVFGSTFTISSGGAGMRTIFGDYEPAATEDMVFNIGAECILGFKALTLVPTSGTQVINFAGADSTLSARGDMDLNADLVVNGSGWFEFFGGENQNLVSDQTYITKVRVNKDANSAVFPSAMTLVSFTVQGGTADLNGYDLETVNLTVSGGEVLTTDGGSITAALLTMSGGAIVSPLVGSATYSIYGDVDITGGSFTNPENGLLLINGSAAQSLDTNNVALPDITINKASGTATLASAMTSAGKLLLQAGRFETASYDFNAVTLEHLGTCVFIAGSSTMTVNNWLVAHSTEGSFNHGTSTIVLLGGIVQCSGFYVEPIHITIVDDAVVQIRDAFSSRGGTITYGNNVTIQSEDAATTFWNMRQTNPVLVGAEPTWGAPGTGRITYRARRGVSLGMLSDFGDNDVRIYDIADVTLQTNLVCRQLKIDGGGAVLLTNGYDVTCQDFFTGEASNFNTTGNLRLQGATIFTCTGDFTIRSRLDPDEKSSLLADVGSTAEIHVGGNLDIWENSVVTLEGDNKITFNGTIAQSASFRGHTIPTVEVTNAAAAVTFTQAFTCTDFICETAGCELVFQANTAFTITNDLTLNGAAGNNISLDSHDSTDRFEFVLSVADQVGSYLTVDNSEISGESYAVTYSTLGANTDKDEAAPHWLKAVSLWTWTGAGADDLWTNADNWDQGYGYPQDEYDAVLFDSGDDDVVIPAAVTDLYSLSLEGTFTGSVTQEGDVEFHGNTLTVLTGTYDQDGHDTTTAGDLNIRHPGNLLTLWDNLTVNGDITFDGAGTSGDPYLITHLIQLQRIDSNRSAYYLISNEIDASDSANWNGGAGFKPIRLGSEWGFRGQIDGQHNPISGLTIQRSSSNQVGLVSWIDAGSSYPRSLVNIRLIDANIRGHSRVGGILGDGTEVGSNPTITNCFVSGTVRGSSSGDSVGGIIGRTRFSFTINNVVSHATVIGGEDVGGVAGRIHDNAIEDSYAIGPVTGTQYVGGFIGQGPFSGHAMRCFSAGTVTGTQDVGGFIGYSAGTHSSNCFWDVESSGIGNSGDAHFGSTGKTTAEMKDLATYTDIATIGLDDPWDMVPVVDPANIWGITLDLNGGYPFLQAFVDMMLTASPVSVLGTSLTVLGSEVTIKGYSPWVPPEYHQHPVHVLGDPLTVLGDDVKIQGEAK